MGGDGGWGYTLESNATGPRAPGLSSGPGLGHGTLRPQIRRRYVEDTPMTQPPLLIVLLAAGMGVRMRSRRAKVLHPLAGRSLLGHALARAQAAGASQIAVVVAPGMAEVRAEALAHAPTAQVFEQASQAGTADAVLAARHALERHRGDVLVLFADTPLIEAPTLNNLIGALGQGANIAVLGFAPEDATGYGRLILDASGRVAAIREHKEASATERAQRLCNAGAMAFRVPSLVDLIGRIGNDNAAKEYYLTDVVALARSEGLIALPVVCSPQEAMGINTREQLAMAEAIFQARARANAMREGVTMIAPDTVWLSYDTAIGRDVTIEPNVYFGPGVVIAEGAEILANSHIVGARIGEGACYPGTTGGGHQRAHRLGEEQLDKGLVHYREAGEMLRKVKDQVGHGKFQKWIAVPRSSTRRQRIT